MTRGSRCWDMWILEVLSGRKIVFPTDSFYIIFVSRIAMEVRSRGLEPPNLTVLAVQLVCHSL
jgi:hypothetical protein